MIASTGQNPPAPAPEVVVIPWGDPALVNGDEITGVGPAWCTGASKLGGAWVSNLDGSPIPGWAVDEPETNSACLLIFLNRSLVTNDLRMGVTLSLSTGAVVGVDLLDGRGAAAGANPVGELAAGQDAAAVSSIVLPLRQRPEASVIRIRREGGGVVVYNTTLTPANGDGVDNAGQGGLVAVGGAGGAPSTAVNEGANSAASQTVAVDVEPGGLDGDGVLSTGDLAMVDLGTNIQMRVQPGARVIYVNSRTGRDTSTGRMATVSEVDLPGGAQSPSAPAAVDGPKATIQAGVAASGPMGTVVVQGGDYWENINNSGRAINIRIDGDVNLTGMPSLPAPPPAEGAIRTNGVQATERTGT
jgi:hypothetical protein